MAKLDRREAFRWMCEQENGFSSVALAEKFGVTRRWASRLLREFRAAGAVQVFYTPGTGGRYWFEVIEPDANIDNSYPLGMHPNQLAALARETAKRIRKSEGRGLPQEAIAWWPAKPELCCWTGVPEAIAYAAEVVEQTTLDEIAA